MRTRHSACSKIPPVAVEDEIFTLSSDESERDEFEARFASTSARIDRQSSKQSNSTTVGQRRRGILQRIQDLPLEIILEIYSYLMPFDILRLSRTSKDIRAFLMTRSNASVWRTARYNVPELPPLPSDLTEPQYANLAFDSYCHICMRKPCDSVFWQCRIRCCNRCFDSAFYSRSNMHSVWNRSYAATFLVFREIAQYIPYVPVVPWKGPWNGEDKVYYPPAIRILRHEYQRVRTGETKLDDWLQQKKEAYEENTKHTGACSDWQRANKNKRAEDLQIARLRRKSAIYEKLRALGWGREIDRLETEGSSLLARHKAVRQTKDLTEQAWNRMKPQLIQLLKEDQKTSLH
ncbi:hypothetical protein C8R42DRAFT_7245 [Lentinula raphanica]|nr:hypothetical protein C8R42DRAFT_7245 [Lentinula raphanica]KAJ3822330.1 hypothetical protein F5880DRAFT_692280 [Lentinula raphanica]